LRKASVRKSVHSTRPKTKAKRPHNRPRTQKPSMKGRAKTTRRPKVQIKRAHSMKRSAKLQTQVQQVRTRKRTSAKKKNRVKIQRAHTMRKTVQRPPHPIMARRKINVSEMMNFISRTLDTEWQNYLTLNNSFQKPTAKNVHDLRVSIRRLMTIIEFTERFNSDNAARRSRIILKEQLSALGDLRDAHVETLKIRRYLKHLP